MSKKIIDPKDGVITYEIAVDELINMRTEPGGSEMIGQIISQAVLNYTKTSPNAVQVSAKDGNILVSMTFAPKEKALEILMMHNQPIPKRNLVIKKASSPIEFKDLPY